MPWLPPMPSAAAEHAQDSASATIRPMTWALEKPSVLSTAISVRRSRTAMLMVLAVTSRIVKLTARPMLLRSKARLPAMAMKPAAKACSVSVWVWRVAVLEQGVDGLADRRPPGAGSSISTV